MIYSMTGFGRGSAGSGINKVSLTIKAINGKFLDLKLRGLNIDPYDEKKIKTILTDKLIRGTVSINLVQEDDSKYKSLLFNEDRFKAINKILNKIEKKYNKNIPISSIITSGDLFSNADSAPINSKLIIAAVKKACKNITIMRKEEGKRIEVDFHKRIKFLNHILVKIEKQLPKDIFEKEKRYRKKIKELINDTKIEELRLLQEISIMAEKADLTEEVVRLKSHFGQFNKMISDKEPAGRRLNFLLQEIGREINTIGSKSISDKIVTMLSR